ncbi:MAG: YARHG domain-containing protein [Deltaproteobacteria bacterium]|nr:YARHG domain-containing protein [Deltaproteobacteria bacterium]
MNENIKSCPYCGETIQVKAIKCKWCREFIDVVAEKSDSDNQQIVKPRKKWIVAIVLIIAVYLLILLGLFIYNQHHKTETIRTQNSTYRNGTYRFDAYAWKSAMRNLDPNFSKAPVELITKMVDTFSAFTIEIQYPRVTANFGQTTMEGSLSVVYKTDNEVLYKMTPLAELQKDQTIMVKINEDKLTAGPDGNEKQLMYFTKADIVPMLNEGENKHNDNGDNDLEGDERDGGNNSYQTTTNTLPSSDQDYLLPNSDKEYIDYDDLSMFTQDQLAFARNEIFARHGYVFTDKPKSKRYKDYFEAKSWYHANPYYDGNISDIEKYNIEIIKKQEKLLLPPVYGNDGDVLPHSSERLLTEEDLEYLTIVQLGYARNEIYARHGFVFSDTPKSKKYKNYFEAKSWYKPDVNYNGLVSDTEEQNIKLIKKHEGL